jgi:hypothetical protein
MSKTEYEARVAGVEYLLIAIGFPAYAVGSLVLPSWPQISGIVPALGMLVLLVVVSLRIPWSCRVSDRGVLLRFWVGGLVRTFLPKANVRVVVATRSDWGRKTREVRIASSDGLLRLVGWATIANARFGVPEDRSLELLDAFRHYGYSIESEGPAV